MAGQVKKTVELFYDVVSPYTWIGFEVLCRCRQTWNIDLKFKPFFLGGIMHGAGNSPPGAVPRKGAYALQDLHRIRNYYKLPMNEPKDVGEVMFVKGSLPAMRYITAVEQHKPEKVEDVSRELFKRVWSTDEDILEHESILQAADRAGLSAVDAQSMLDKIGDKAIKDKLKERTEEALNYGAFGSPTIIAHDAKGDKHMLFGSDRFHILAQILGEKEMGPLNEFAHPKARL